MSKTITIAKTGFLRQVGEPAGGAQQLGGDAGADYGGEIGGDERHPALHVLEDLSLSLRQLQRHVTGGLDDVWIKKKNC